MVTLRGCGRKREKKGGRVKRGKETKREIKEGKSEGKRQRIKRERGGD